jgi:hypothetical protein
VDAVEERCDQVSHEILLRIHVQLPARPLEE